jgi:hypothetical protein
MAADSGGVVFGSGIRFIDTTAGTKSVSATTVNAVFSNLDGLSRTDVLRYDTPRFGGLALATSYIAGGDWDIGADYRAKAGAIKLRVQAQYNNTSATSTTRSDEMSMSAAALHDSGLNGAIAFGKREVTGSNDPSFVDVDFGYRAKIFGVGGTNFSVNVQHTDDLSADNSDARSVGFTIAQLIDPVGASMAVTYKNYTFDTASNSFDDIDVLSLQTVFKF